MTPPWGINWQRYHADRQDMPHIEKMGYRSFTIYEWMWNNRDFCNELLSVARKDAIFLNRDHPLSEQKDDQWINDPALKGRNHANEWAQKVKEGRVYTPLDRTYFLGLNEPDSHKYQRQIDTYNEAFCRRMTQHGLRVAAYSFGVGQPSTVDLLPKNPPDWSWYAASAAAVLEGDHIVAAHEYGAPTVGGYGWGYWCGRIAYCPYPFRVIFDECGIDNGVVNSGELYGYAKFMDGPQYALWLDGFQVGQVERVATYKVTVLSYNIFGFDHGSSEKKDWHSFDIRPMRPLLEAFQWTDAKPTQPPSPSPGSPPGPVPPPTGPTAWPITPAGSRIRSGPGVTFSVLGAVATGIAMRVTGIAPSGTWYRVESPFGVGWVSATVVETRNVENVPLVDDAPSEPPVQPPAPTATGIIDPLTALAFLQVESGNKPFTNGLLTIRFEVHRFKANFKDDRAFDNYFKFTPGKYDEQYWRKNPDGEWLHAHGSMEERHRLLTFARYLNDTAALRSTGMGMAQVMGENHARVGYKTPQAMLNAFSHKDYGVNAQVLGFVNYVLSDPGLFTALRNRDWWEAVTRYNGEGQQAAYIQQLEATLERIESEAST